MNKFIGILVWMLFLGSSDVKIINKQDGSTTKISGWSNSNYIWYAFVAVVWMLIISYILKII
jgi:hypothetical protein